MLSMEHLHPKAARMLRLKYGNTNTYFIQGDQCSLLVDTDYAGSVSAFYKAIKKVGIKVSDIGYVLATHYHPDHMGIIGDLTEQGVGLLLLEEQMETVHFSDSIFERERLPFIPINEKSATVIRCNESRAFLFSIGISGEIIRTPSHSKDSVSLIMDDGNCFVGDLEPPEYAEAYKNNNLLKTDWERIMSFSPKTVFYAHRPEKHFH